MKEYHLVTEKTQNGFNQVLNVRIKDGWFIEGTLIVTKAAATQGYTNSFSAYFDTEYSILLSKPKTNR